MNWSYYRFSLAFRHAMHLTVKLIHCRLNLTVATQAHLLEPQWNPSVEAQAIGPVLRLTQKKAVTVIRYIMRATVEEVRLQI
jgi:SNF2 family DNA or RNA helicase